MDVVVRSEEEWKKLLKPEQYHVLREKGTERPYTNKYDHHFEPGTYACAACGQELFESKTKFDSGCGWPAFYAAQAGDRVQLTPDSSHGMSRTEVTLRLDAARIWDTFSTMPPRRLPGSAIASIPSLWNSVRPRARTNRLPPRRSSGHFSLGGPTAPSCATVWNGTE